MNKLPELTAAVRHTALAVYQSLLLAMTDREIISKQDACALLSDAATPRPESSTRSQTPEMHAAVGEIIERILDAKDEGSSDQDPEAYAGA